MSFGERLKELRLARGLTLREVSVAIDMSIMGYAHYERGETEPTLAILRKLCDLFDVSSDYLIGRTDNY